MTLEALAQLAIGPAGSIVVMGAVLYGIWRLTTEFIIPRIDKQLAESRNNFKELIEVHNKDREVWLKSIEKISDRMDELHAGMQEMSDAVTEVTDTLSKIEQELRNRREH